MGKESGGGNTGNGGGAVVHPSNRSSRSAVITRKCKFSALAQDDSSSSLSLQAPQKGLAAPSLPYLGGGQGLHKERHLQDILLICKARSIDLPMSSKRPIILYLCGVYRVGTMDFLRWGRWS